MKYAHMVAFILLVVGGIAWGIQGLLGYSIVSAILGGPLAQIVYILVGVAAVYEVVTHKGRCKECTGQM